jgi:hypothetical protein
LSIILPSTSSSSKNSLFFRFPHQITMCSYRKNSEVFTKFLATCFGPFWTEICLSVWWRRIAERNDNLQSETSRCLGTTLHFFQSLDVSDVCWSAKFWSVSGSNVIWYQALKFCSVRSS